MSDEEFFAFVFSKRKRYWGWVLLLVCFDSSGLLRLLLVKEEKFQEEVVGMLLNDETDDYIRDWMKKKHSVSRERVDDLIWKGMIAKRAVIRKRALMRLIVALVVCIPLGACLWFASLIERRMFVSMFPLLGGFLACLGYAGKQFVFLLKGDSSDL